MRLSSFALGDNPTLYLILQTEVFSDVQTKPTSHQEVLLSFKIVMWLTKSFLDFRQQVKDPTTSSSLGLENSSPENAMEHCVSAGRWLCLSQRQWGNVPLLTWYLCLPRCFPSCFSCVLSQNARGHAGSTKCAFPQLPAVGQTSSLGGVLWLEQIFIVAYATGMVLPIKAAWLTVFLEKWMIKKLPQYIKGSIK